MQAQTSLSLAFLPKSKNISSIPIVSNLTFEYFLAPDITHSVGGFSRSLWCCYCFPKKCGFFFFPGPPNWGKIFPFFKKNPGKKFFGIKNFKKNPPKKKPPLFWGAFLFFFWGFFPPKKNPRKNPGKKTLLPTGGKKGGEKKTLFPPL
ncbi:MAG: hypothetical protein CM15mV133_150 [uncultured marine virus]|nr:MAG: hypothetical protein CM15mV133_150 [uncultured marine virus]